ncbi:Cleavage and polyadenylation specificity factor subunit 1 [Holothuria leucospilota]|uniref:Cleavage and polyadenylation specificity factor subunit 1 n=1 Tax=Holothuria leucospilota TaxID=206669 RepID=A0A9Q1CAI5_HOLLE|nr:Cleavage and polyadenylation specificity factor subunit 1 [Holothuria leucospilota]
MYAFYRQVHPPTGIEYSLYCNFINKDEKNLIVAKATELTVYRLITDVEIPLAKVTESTGDEKKKEKLEQVATYQLSSRISSMKAAPLASLGRDALLLGFMDAKLSVVEYDVSTHEIKTLSMHHFEEEELKNGYGHNTHLPTIQVDPDFRCAVMLVYGTTLVVLPFKRESFGDDLDGVNHYSIRPSYLIKLKETDDLLSNVIDMQFLHGYYEPTLVILHEPVRTWPGRVAVRHDTCRIVALSINISQKVHPVIWSQSSLPYDCLQVHSVPKPIGGIIIFAVNSLLYLNQSIPPYGVSLNSVTDWSTTFPLKKQENVTLALDVSRAAFISKDTMVISLKGGEIYVLTLLVDGLRTMRGFDLSKAASSVLTTCVCAIDGNYLFLGSRLGNSLLLKYTKKAPEESRNGTSKGEPPAKKQKSDDRLASDLDFLEDPEELEVYGKEVSKSGNQVSSYSFEVCDSLLNIGPCGNMVMGEPAVLSEEFQNNGDPDLELVTTSGYGKNGALSILQQTIRPQVVTTFQLPGCLDMWTVYGPPKKEGSVKADGELTNPHAYLILSKEDTSMILQTGQEISEVDESGFSTQASTVFAGNLGDNNYIIQVSQMGVRLLKGVKQLQHIPLDIGSPIESCSTADPYVVIMSEQGDLILLTLTPDPQGKGHRLNIQKPQVSQSSRIIAIAAYRDVSGLFTTTSEVQSSAALITRPDDRVAVEEANQSTIDDEDELLYGPSEPKISFEGITATVTSQPTIQEKLKPELEPTHWCAVCRENGVMEILRLPEFEPVFLVRNFPMAQRLLVDSVLISSSGEQQKQSHEMLPVVKEILLVGMGNKKRKLYLMAIVDEELLMYEAFAHHGGIEENHLKVRFRKVSHDILMREKKKRTKKGTKNQPETVDPTSGPSRKVKRLRPFNDVSSYSGVFVCGPYPCWLIMTSRGALWEHSMTVDGPVTCFAAFHNVNCPRGFLYFNKMDELRVSVLPSHLTYDAPWPVRKIPMRCTPHFVQYHAESKTYAVITSTLETCNHIVRFNGEERELEEVDRGKLKIFFFQLSSDERFVYSTKDKFFLQLYSPLNWEAIPNTKIEYDVSEHVTCLKIVTLNIEGNMRSLLGMGTGQVYSEDFVAKGRVYIYDVIEVVPEPGQPLTKNKLKMLFKQEHKGCVSSLCDVKGQLLTTIGQKVYLWTIKDDTLVGLAFIDTQLYINNAISIKHFVLISDINKSVFLLQYQEEHRTLALVSRDAKPLEVYSCEFLVDDTQLGFLASDADKNLIILHYHAEARESYGGTRLLRRGDINVDSHINAFVRIRCKLIDMATGVPIGGQSEKRQIAFFASLDGGLGYLLPMSEKTYRRLLMLQNTLTTSIPHIAGLNPRGSRHLNQGHKTLSNPHRNIIDGDLIWRFTTLSITERNELAKRIGTNADQILDDLMDIERVTMHF